MSPPNASTPLLPGSAIGILGAGQLGRFLALEARYRGYGVSVYCPDPEAPAAQIADHAFASDYTDTEALREFARTVQGVTFEFENIPSSAVSFLEQETLVRPGSLAIATAQHRLREKRFFRDQGIPTPSFAEILELQDLDQDLDHVGFPAVMKTAGFGYDGKGQRKVPSREDLSTAWDSLERQPCILEAWIPYAREVSLLVARDCFGEIVSYPLIENIHRNHILDVSLFPAPAISTTLQKEAEVTGRRIVEALDYVGILCIEFFQLRNGHLMVNEMAPRPHNSGHLTIDAHAVSQYGQQLRCLTGMRAGPAIAKVPHALMMNLIGQDLASFRNALPHLLDTHDNLSPHIYGKKAIKPGRKMGHFTLLGDDPSHLISQVNSIRRTLQLAGGQEIVPFQP